jgi:protein tyrosine phosphatase (PTP) superfamily phosphohydrolase (DUF442 family)
MQFRGKPAVRWIFRVSMLVVLPPLLWIGWIEANSNFGIVQPARIFRAGQMSSSTLNKTIRERGIKTVLNLRGVNPTDRWYVQERDTTTSLGATQIDVHMSSCQWLSHDELNTLIKTLDECAYPLLIHCAWGSERTALISIRHLFVPLGDGKLMAYHLDAYESWLRSQKIDHRPETFRAWIANAYQPLSPSREEWPYDPYPLRTVTLPDRTVQKTMGRQLPSVEAIRR